MLRGQLPLSLQPDGLTITCKLCAMRTGRLSRPATGAGIEEQPSNRDRAGHQGAGLNLSSAGQR